MAAILVLLLIAILFPALQRARRKAMVLASPVVFVGTDNRLHMTDPSGRIYTFYLRQNATFHDGRPLKAGQVRASLLRALAPGRRIQERYEDWHRFD